MFAIHSKLLLRINDVIREGLALEHVTKAYHRLKHQSRNIDCAQEMQLSYDVSDTR